MSLDYGLALAGGGARGAAHIGVLKALAEENFLPSSIAGTSAGSIAAGLFAAGLTIDELCEVVEFLGKQGKTLMDPDCWGIIRLVPQLLMRRSPSLTGFLKGNKLKRLFCQLTDNISIKEAAIKLVIPAVDLKSGDTIAYTNSNITHKMEHVVWETDARLCEVMMASASVPTVFRPRILGGRYLVDGGVTNNLPADLLIAAGSKRVLAVDVGEDYESLKHNSIVDILVHSFDIMSRSLKDCMSREESMLLKPELPKEAGLLTFDYMTACMEAGYRYTKVMMPVIRRTITQTV